MNWLCLVIGFAVGLLVGEFVLMLAMMFFSGTGGGGDNGDKQKLEELESKVAWLMDTVEDMEPFEDDKEDWEPLENGEKDAALPCPYCGGTNISLCTEFGYYIMVCGFCHAQTFGTKETLNNPLAALELWNLGGTNIMCPSTDFEGQNER